MLKLVTTDLFFWYLQKWESFPISSCRFRPFLPKNFRFELSSEDPKVETLFDFARWPGKLDKQKSYLNWFENTLNKFEKIRQELQNVITIHTLVIICSLNIFLCLFFCWCQQYKIGKPEEQILSNATFRYNSIIKDLSRLSFNFNLMIR